MEDIVALFMLPANRQGLEIPLFRDLDTAEGLGLFFYLFPAKENSGAGQASRPGPSVVCFRWVESARCCADQKVMAA